MLDETTIAYTGYVLGSLSIAVLLHLLVRRSPHEKDAPPMAPTGMLETIRKLSADDFPWFMLDTAKNLGTRTFRINLPLPGMPMVVVVGDPTLMREILNDKGTFKPAALYKSFDSTTNGVQSLFTDSGPFWHARRKGIAPAFAANQVARMNAVAVEKANEWIEKKLGTDGASFNVSDEMIDLLLVSICQTAFEFKLGKEDMQMFKSELNLIMKEFLFKTSTNPLRQVFGLFLADRRRAFVASRRVHELSLEIIAAYRALENPTKGTIIDLIMNNPCYENDDQRAADVTVLMVGGHDTTAYSLSWALKGLAQNPEIQSQLREDLKANGPNNNEFLKKVIREAIRWHVVSAGGSIRQVVRDFTTKDGKVIPKGSYVFLSFLLALRDPATFGKDVNEFNPNRWDNATPEMNSAFLPFAVGRQNCVGQSLANAELQSILPLIVSQFNLEVENEGRTEYFLTMKPVDLILKATPLSVEQQ